MAYSSKDNGTKKEKRARELQEFRSIFRKLRAKLTLEEMAVITGIGASNLSAYGSGAKDPAKATIEKFYAKLKSHIDKLAKSGRTTKNSAQANQVEEERPPYGKRSTRTKDHIGDLIKILSTNNDRMWTDNEKNGKRLDKIVDNSNRLVDNNAKLVDTTNQLAGTNAELATTNARLYEKLFPNSGDASTPGASGSQS